MAKKSVLSVLDPFDNRPYAPEVFKPFGDSEAADKYNRKTFQIAAIVPMAFLVGAAVRRSLGRSSEELKKLEKTGPLATSMISPVVKEAGDPIYGTLSITAPILAAYTALLMGAKTADRNMQGVDNKRLDKEIASAETQYNDELQKRLYPHSVKKASIPEALDTLGLLRWLSPVLLGLAGGAAVVGKKYTDANSEERAKARALKKSYEKKAKTQWVPKLELPGELPKDKSEVTV